MRLGAADLERDCFRCPRCGGLARPNVWFCADRGYRVRDELGAVSTAYHHWLEGLQEAGKQVAVVEVGAGLAIPSIRVTGEDAIVDAGDGSTLIRVNPADCRVPAERAVGVPLGGREGLQRIDAALRQRMRRARPS